LGTLGVCETRSTPLQRFGNLEKKRLEEKIAESGSPRKEKKNERPEGDIEPRTEGKRDQEDNLSAVSKGCFDRIVYVTPKCARHASDSGTARGRRCEKRKKKYSIEALPSLSQKRGRRERKRTAVYNYRQTKKENLLPKSKLRRTIEKRAKTDTSTKRKVGKKNVFPPSKLAQSSALQKT